MLKLALLSVALLAAPTIAFAQAPPNPAGFNGAVVSIAEDGVSLKTKDGSLAKVAMTAGWTVASTHAATAQDIKPGDFIASINANVGPNAGRSTELRIFTPGYRPEIGTHDMPMPNTSITHGVVKASTKGPAGQELDIVYPGGSRHLTVPSDVKVTAYDLHDRGALKPGVMVGGVTRKDPDGVARAGQVVLAN